MTRRDKFWDSGYRAFVAGIRRGNCPLAAGSPARKQWFNGWNTAHRDSINRTRIGQHFVRAGLVEQEPSPIPGVEVFRFKK